MTTIANHNIYEVEKIEAKWQAEWRAGGAFRTLDADPELSDTYIFVAPPFTSGDAHMGHVRSYSIGDAHARFRRAIGDAVLFSLGFDSFGLPAELGAIENNLTPRQWVDRCSRRMRDQFDRLGFSFDWSRTFLTCEPEMYRWSQWMFITLLEADLIYQRDGHVDWCDSCETVLASSQTEGGTCWRCHETLQLVRMPQWYLRLSAYNEENDRRVAKLSEIWNEAAVAAQRTLLGRIDGVEFDATTLGGSPLTVFTPLPDEIQEGVFVAISPRHPDIDDWLDDEVIRQQVNELRMVGVQRDDRSAADAPHVDTGLVVQVSGIPNPLPVVISPTVDTRYGPTAVLGVPSQDRMARAIAEQLAPPSSITWKVQRRPLVTRPAVRYRAADFPISRQRAWGAPIPIVYCSACGTVPVPIEQLPVLLPDDLTIAGNGNALKESNAFVECYCPACGRPARRENDTLDCHVDVFWIYMAVAVPREDRASMLFEHPELNRWLPVEQFIQGADTGGFVLDERMVAKALRDLGVMTCLPDGEPYGRTLMHEMVQLDGRKMSKHLGNVVTPTELIEEAGADALRFSVLYAAAPSKRFNWDANVLDFSRAFLQRLWAFAEPRLREASGMPDLEIEPSTAMRRRLASWCDTAAARVTENYHELKMHRATRNLILLLDRVEDFERRIVKKRAVLTERDREAVASALRLLVQLIAPIAPHMAEELWWSTGQRSLLAEADWPIRLNQTNGG
jgi:leucyl-tRNA synthetase